MRTESAEMTRSLDIDFAVPFRHRLRFTDDVRREPGVLQELLMPSGPDPAKVQLWLDRQVSQANPTFASGLERIIQECSQLELVDATQLIEGGEACKNDYSVIERVLETMNEAGLDRRSYVIVVGGGAVLDAIGFAAGVAHRGIRLVRFPTTTLGQADSGVGVKNAVNLFHKKNWVGTFAVPWAVINDLSLLKTLPDRDFVSGFSEAVKVALLKSPTFFANVCEVAHKIRHRDMTAAADVIAESAKWHLRHITHGGDPFEALEARPLDFGHWSAHKLEPMSDFRIRHGEAVSIGVAIDVVYSSIVHGLSQDDAHRALLCLHHLGLPLSDSLLEEDTNILFAGLEEFRQHLGGRLTVTMLDGIGQPIDVHEIDQKAMRIAIHRVMDFANRLRDGRRNGVLQRASDLQPTVTSGVQT